MMVRLDYRARYYDPTIGRFISEDPARFSVGANYYSYTKNRPLITVDPSGLSGEAKCPAGFQWYCNRRAWGWVLGAGSDNKAQDQGLVQATQYAPYNFATNPNGTATLELYAINILANQNLLIDAVKAGTRTADDAATALAGMQGATRRRC
jgi:hypothetical protein